MARKEKTQIALEYEKARKQAYWRVQKAKSRGWTFSDRLYKVLEKKDSPRTRDIERLNALRGERLYKYGTRHVEPKPKKSKADIRLEHEQRNLARRIRNMEKLGITVSADIKSMVTRKDVTPEAVRAIRGKRLYEGAVFVDPDSLGVVGGEELYGLVRRGVVQAIVYLRNNDITAAFKLIDARIEKIDKKDQKKLSDAEKTVRREAPGLMEMYNEEAEKDPVGFARRMQENAQAIRENLEILSVTYNDDEARGCVSVVISLFKGAPESMEEAKQREEYNTESLQAYYTVDKDGFMTVTEGEDELPF